MEENRATPFITYVCCGMWAKAKILLIKTAMAEPYPSFVQGTILACSRAEEDFKFFIMANQIINTAKAPAPIGPYSQAVQSGTILFISGQVAIDPSSGEMKNATLQDEATQVMKNLSAILSEAGYAFSDVVKTTIFLSDMSLFAEVNEIYSKSFGAASVYPARETVAVKGLPKNANVEISMIACK